MTTRLAKKKGATCVGRDWNKPRIGWLTLLLLCAAQAGAQPRDVPAQHAASLTLPCANAEDSLAAAATMNVTRFDAGVCADLLNVSALDETTPNYSERAELYFRNAFQTESAAAAVPRTVDRSFILLSTLSTMSVVADIESTAHAFQDHPQFKDLNPFAGAHPTRVRMYALSLPIQSFMIYMAHRWKKLSPENHTWEVAPAVTLTLHTIATVHNVRDDLTK